MKLLNEKKQQQLNAKIEQNQQLEERLVRKVSFETQYFEVEFPVSSIAILKCPKFTIRYFPLLDGQTKVNEKHARGGLEPGPTTQ